MKIKVIALMVGLLVLTACGDGTVKVNKKTQSQNVNELASDPIVQSLATKGLSVISSDGDYYTVSANYSDSYAGSYTYKGLIHKNCINDGYGSPRCVNVNGQQTTFTNFCTQMVGQHFGVISVGNPCSGDIISGNGPL